MATLRPYQEGMVEALLSSSHYALFVEMGLGKTAAVLTALERLDMFGLLPRPILVAGPPKVVRHTWPNEAAIWLPGWTVAEAVTELDPDVINTVSIAKLAAANQMGWTPGTLIIDELSMVKTFNQQRAHASARSYAAYQMGRRAKVVWGMTGMVAPNDLRDVWGQMAVIDAGRSLGDAKGVFEKAFMYVDPDTMHSDSPRLIPRTGAVKEVAERIRIRSMSLRAIDVALELPELVVQSVPVEIPRDVMKKYKTMKAEGLAEIEEAAKEENTQVVAFSAGAVAMKLRQITGGFIHDTLAQEWHALHTAKLDALADLRAELDGPLLVAIQFRSEAAAIIERFGAVEMTEDNIDAWNAGELPMVVTHPATVGHGLNLQFGGNHIVWYSLPWSLDHWAQTNARLARSGQPHDTVFAHVLEVPNTYDGIVRRALQGKGDLQNSLMEHLREETT